MEKSYSTQLWLLTAITSFANVLFYMQPRPNQHMYYSMSTGPDLNPIRPCLVKMWGPSYKFPHINVQKLTTNSALQLHTFCCYIITDSRYGFRNSEASLYIGQRMSRGTKWTCHNTRHKELSSGLWMPIFGRPCSAKHASNMPKSASACQFSVVHSELFGYSLTRSVASRFHKCISIII